MEWATCLRVVGHKAAERDRVCLKGFSSENLRYFGKQRNAHAPVEIALHPSLLTSANASA